MVEFVRARNSFYDDVFIISMFYFRRKKHHYENALIYNWKFAKINKKF